MRPQAGLAELVLARGARGARGASRPRASTRDARRSNSSASSFEMPRWRRSLWACVKASANVRAAALGSWYSGRAPAAVSRSEAMPVANESRTEAAGSEPDALAEADDGIEHDAGRAGERAAVERLRDRRGPARGRGSARDRSPIRPGPAAGLRGSGRGPPTPPARPSVARAPMAEQRGALGQVLRLEEQLAEGRMREVVGGGSEDDLGVARDSISRIRVALVGHGQPAHLDVVFGRDRDVELRRRCRRRGGGSVAFSGRNVDRRSRPAPGASADRWPTRRRRSARRAGR